MNPSSSRSRRWSFAAVVEASAAPLIGDETDTILAAGGSAVWYGDGGAGKTTLGLDQAFHLCAGRHWLGLPVPRACKVLWVENEGPRGKFREKLRAKLAAWDGAPLEGRLHVLEKPWSMFTFADDRHRSELAALVRELEIDVVFAGPVQRLGVEGGGTPAEIEVSVNLLERVRGELERPLAYELVHHEAEAARPRPAARGRPAGECGLGEGDAAVPARAGGRTRSDDLRGRRHGRRGPSVKAMFVLPFASADAPAWLHQALETRALATVIGRCPCRATYDRSEVRPGEVHTPAMEHRPGCPAVDPRLGSPAMLPDWVELHTFAVDIPGEAAA